MSTTAGGARVLRQARGDLEAVDVGQLHVEQHDLGVQRTRAASMPVDAVLGLTDDLVALGFEQRARAAAEARMVVDDEHGHGHRDESCQTGTRSVCTVAHTFLRHRFRCCGRANPALASASDAFTASHSSMRCEGSSGCRPVRSRSRSMR